MEENRNDIEILKAMIKDNFEEQRKLIAKLETALEAVTSFNGKQMLDSRDMRLMLKVCDRTLIRWRNSGVSGQSFLAYCRSHPQQPLPAGHAAGIHR